MFNIERKGGEKKLEHVLGVPLLFPFSFKLDCLLLGYLDISFSLLRCRFAFVRVCFHVGDTPSQMLLGGGLLSVWLFV